MNTLDCLLRMTKSRACSPRLLRTLAKAFGECLSSAPTENFSTAALPMSSESCHSTKESFEIFLSHLLLTSAFVNFPTFFLPCLGRQCHTRPGDCINAAVMLNEFVSEETQWAHCDIAGTSWNFAENCATGYGVRTLVSFIKGLDRSQKQ
mmetsp:Transcript_20298/g.81833  ORF Transcript_20298/g.81833 Transcript_20298/m.81833 type:complete len:150 (+) Transcript_20298:1413-1862(+)